MDYKEFRMALAIKIRACMAVGVDGGVVPGGHIEGAAVARWRDICVRALEDEKGFLVGFLILPLWVGFGDMTPE